MSSAQQFFDSFINKKSIEEAVNRKQEEGLYLEFKKKRDRSNPDLEDDDKENFADGLSMFANSDGGVQIWGVETKKLPDDRAVKLKPITQVDFFANNLRNYLKGAIMPQVDGVIIESIYDNETQRDGYVKVLIPASEKTPHRSMKSREYLKRNQSGEYKLEHFDLEDMFGRRQRPYLGLRFELGKKTESSGEISITTFVLNEGKTIGRDAMAVIFFNKYIDVSFQIFNMPSDRTMRIDEMHHNNPTFQINLRDSLFYPSVTTRIGQFKILSHHQSSHNNIGINWVIYADYMLPKTGSINVQFTK